jgi:hypothetical protein
LELDEKLKVTQVNNKQTMATIAEQRAEMEQLIGGLESVVKDLEGSIDALSGADELKQDVWMMEQEVAATR